jgi:hypothetical protein
VRRRYRSARLDDFVSRHPTVLERYVSVHCAIQRGVREAKRRVAAAYTAAADQLVDFWGLMPITIGVIALFDLLYFFNRREDHLLVVDVGALALGHVLLVIALWHCWRSASTRAQTEHVQLIFTSRAHLPRIVDPHDTHVRNVQLRGMFPTIGDGILYQRSSDRTTT